MLEEELLEWHLHADAAFALAFTVMVVVVVARLCRRGDGKMSWCPFSTKRQRVSFVGYTGGEGGKFSLVEPTKPTRPTSVRYGGCSLKVTSGSEGFYMHPFRS